MGTAPREDVSPETLDDRFWPFRTQDYQGVAALELPLNFGVPLRLC